jgi:hypothetical protein
MAFAVSVIGPTGCAPVSFEVFMAVTMANVVLGYKNPVRTSQETYYVFATEHSRLKLCKV